jgi:hypothetical protein
VLNQFALFAAGQNTLSETIQAAKTLLHGSQCLFAKSTMTNFTNSFGTLALTFGTHQMN